MEDLYSIHPVINRRFASSTTSCDEASVEIGVGSDLTDLLKSQIASHPRYPALVSAYIECRKVGAPPEMATVLDEIGRESTSVSSLNSCLEMGSDPDLDDFMESYCLVLEKYREELSKPFDEAETFLSSMETQLRNLCNDRTNDDALGSSEEGFSCGDVETSEGQDSSNSLAGDNELKEMLLKKYSGYLSSLRKEFLKKRKKGKLPKDARLTLLNWWNTHYRWPYPTEEEKARLAETTGLDQKQINNWFINQRKRHWKPSEDMRLALMEGVSGGSTGAALYFETGMIGPGTS